MTQVGATLSYRFESLVESIDGIVWELALPEWNFTFVSKQAERILGYPVELWLEDPNFWRDHVHADDRTWALDFRMAATDKGEDYQFEYRMIAFDGRIVWLRDIVTVETSEGLPARLRGVMVDFTERKNEEMFHAGQRHVLEMIAADAPLQEALKGIVTSSNRNRTGCSAPFCCWTKTACMCVTEPRRACLGAMSEQ